MSGDIDYSKKEIINKWGINDYYPEYAFRDLNKLWYWNNILFRNIEKVEDGMRNYSVYHMNFFSTWWNNNLILFIEGENGGDTYWVKLIVYEMPYKKNGETKIREVFEVFSLECYVSGGLYSAKQGLEEFENKLRSDNPILSVSNRLWISLNDNYSNPLFPVFYEHLGGEKSKGLK